jgi:hypothetical protein
VSYLIPFTAWSYLKGQTASYTSLRPSVCSGTMYVSYGGYLWYCGRMAQIF